MFFMFHILVLSIYIFSTNSYVLKKKHIEDSLVNIDENDNRMNVQDVQNNSWVLSTQKPLFQIMQLLTNTNRPNLKSNMFDKKLSDEMLLMKHIGYDKDMVHTTPNLINHKSSIATPTLEVKLKWPIVDLLSKSDDIPGGLQYIDEFEKIYLISSSLVQKEVSNTEKSTTVSNCESDNQQEESNEKIVGLRSLSADIPSPMPGRVYHSIAIKQCTCAKTRPAATHSVQVGTSIPHKCTQDQTRDCSRTTLSYSILPFYVPYENMFTTIYPTIYYPPTFDEVDVPKHKKHRKRPRPSIKDDLYYEDSLERDKYEEDKYHNDDDDDYLENDRQTPKKNKGKHRKEEVLVIEYDDKPKNQQITWNTKIHQENPSGLANAILDDMKTYYSDTVIKKCYCSSSSLHVVPLLFIIVWFIYVGVIVN